MRRSLAQKSLDRTSLLTFSSDMQAEEGRWTVISLVPIEMKRRTLGPADPPGSSGRPGEPPSLPAVPFLPALTPGLRMPAQAISPRKPARHTAFPELPPVARWEAVCRVSALAGVFQHRNVTWGPKRGRQKSQDAHTLSELVFRLQTCSERTSDSTPFPKCPIDEPSRLPSSFPIIPATVLSEYA